MTPSRGSRRSSLVYTEGGSLPVLIIGGLLLLVGVFLLGVGVYVLVSVLRMSNPMDEIAVPVIFFVSGTPLAAAGAWAVFSRRGTTVDLVGRRITAWVAVPLPLFSSSRTAKLDEFDRVLVRRERRSAGEHELDYFVVYLIGQRRSFEVFASTAQVRPARIAHQIAREASLPVTAEGLDVRIGAGGVVDPTVMFFGLVPLGVDSVPWAFVAVLVATLGPAEYLGRSGLALGGWGLFFLAGAFSQFEWFWDLPPGKVNRDNPGRLVVLGVVLALVGVADVLGVYRISLVALFS